MCPAGRHGIVRTMSARALIRTSAWRDRRDRFGMLLAATAGAFGVEGVATPGAWGRVVVTALLAGTLLLALWAADAKPKVIRAAAIIEGGVRALSIGEAAAGHLLYFTFVTLTTVGYGDFTAAGNLGHTLAVSEALLGQIYLVTIVSLLVSNLGRPHRVER